jgi:hypothetical protein
MDDGTAQGWLTGVCAAVADRFGWNVFRVRTLVVIATIAAGGAIGGAIGGTSRVLVGAVVAVGVGAVTYALLSQFIEAPSGKYGKALKTLAFWLLIGFWSAIPLVYVVLPLTLLGLIDWEKNGAAIGTVLGVANGGTLPVILVAFCITRIVRWWRRRPGSKV